MPARPATMLRNAEATQQERGGNSTIILLRGRPHKRRHALALNGRQRRAIHKGPRVYAAQVEGIKVKYSCGSYDLLRGLVVVRENDRPQLRPSLRAEV